ncbi:MAG: hypothetical protein JW840_04275 [Candidatus Thermoplasmatota archaeon]|nr:hypothetical protein [Candidatus Thermoplasmatota archaeon]
MDEQTIRWIALAILLVVVSIVIVYYVYSLKRTSLEHRRVYLDYAKRFSAGLSGAVVFFLATQIMNIINSGLNLEGKIALIAINFCLALFIIVFTLTLIVKMETRYPVRIAK